LPEKICHDRNQQRPDRQFGEHVVRRHVQNLRKSLRSLEKEGFRHVFVLSNLEAIENVQIERQPLWNNQIRETQTNSTFWNFLTYSHPEGRKAVFLGDLVDRGDRILDTVKLVRNMVVAETGLCVLRNHDIKLMRKLNGKNVKEDDPLRDY
jgi:protein phosphatase